MSLDEIALKVPDDIPSLASNSLAPIQILLPVSSNSLDRSKGEVSRGLPRQSPVFMSTPLRFEHTSTQLHEATLNVFKQS